MFKRRLDGKMLAALTLMVMSVCASAFAGLRSGSWTVNPSDYRYDMSLYFSLASKEYENLDLYEIGAFVDDECRGVAENLDLPDEGSCLYMRIRSNSTQGEEIVFKMRNKVTGETVILKGKDGESFLFKADQMVGLPSEPYVLTRYFNVSIEAGENGTVSFENGMYAEGTVINISAIPETGYHFENWSDGDTAAQRELTVNGDIELTATFAVNIHKAVFKIGDDVIATLDVPYGSAIEAPAAPEKEGYTFSGWTDIPETMPDNDIEIAGVYAVNTYKAIFIIGEQTVATLDLEFGAPITAPDVPELEGHTFAGWSEFPETMPAHDIEITGNYTVNSYKATFKIGDEVISTLDIPFGSEITAPEVPAKEGYSFDGWAELPETMPAHDIEIYGTYSLNKYKAIFKVGEEVVATLDVEFGAAITAPEAPEKEGYTFAGWTDVPETMPAHDIEINGSYTVNSYKAVFKIDSEVVATLDVEFGAAITAPEAPEKEGYTFAGWTDAPETMPAHDIEINGSYTVNTYRLIVYINDDIYMDEELEFGAEIVIPDPELPSNMEFEGWNDEIPATMPAHDVEIHGSATEKVSSALSVIFDEDTLLTVYTINGVLLYKDIKADEIKDRLTPGLYIINGKKLLIK